MKKNVYIFILHLYEGGMKNTCNGSEICKKCLSGNSRCRDLSEHQDVDGRLLFQRTRDLKYGWKSFDWIYGAQWRALVITVMNIWIP
jgi:hypothetical protein